MKTSIQTTQRGFTLVELMVSIAVLAILAMIAYPSYSTYMERVRIDNARATMMDAIQFAERYYATNKTFATLNTAQITAADIANDKYDLEYVAVGANNYLLKATPKADLYSANKRASSPLNVLYSSQSGVFVRCNDSDFAIAAASEPQGTTNCEPLS